MNRLLNAKSLLSDIYTIKVLNVQLAVEGDRGQTINENKIMITKVGMYGGTTVQYVTKNDLFQDCLSYIRRKGFKTALFDENNLFGVVTNFELKGHRCRSSVHSLKDLFSCLLVMSKLISEEQQEASCNADKYNIGDE